MNELDFSCFFIVFLPVVFSLVFVIFRVFFGFEPLLNVFNDVAATFTKSSNKYLSITQSSHPNSKDLHGTYHRRCHHLKSWE